MFAGGDTMDPNTAGWALVVALFLPLAGAGALTLMPASMDREIRRGAVVITAIAFALVSVIALSFDFERAGELQFTCAFEVEAEGDHADQREGERGDDLRAAADLPVHRGGHEGQGPGPGEGQEQRDHQGPASGVGV